MHPQGRRILWGWVNGFPEQRGWNGCLTLPRILTIGSEGWLRQEPAPELATLRGQAFKLENISLHNVTNHLENIRGDTLELRAEFEPVSARRFGVKLRGSADGRRAVDISMDSRFADVAGARLEWGVEGSGGSNSSPVSLRVFLDRTVLEAYVNGRACATRVISPEARDLEVALFAEGGELRVRALEVWPMRSIWSQ